MLQLNKRTTEIVYVKETVRFQDIIHAELDSFYIDWDLDCRLNLLVCMFK